MATRVGTAQFNEDDTNGTTIVGSGIAVQAGDMVVFGTKHEDDGSGGDATTVTVTASGGNGTATPGTYKAHSSPGLFSQMHYLLITVGGTITFTQTLAAARRFRRFYIEVFRPAGGTTLGFDAENTPAEGSGTAMSGGTNALSYTANGFAIGFFGEFSVVTYTAGSGWTASGTGMAAFMEYRTTSGSGTLTVNATASGSMNWTAHGLSFKETAAGATAAITGTATASITEADIVTGGKTIIITLTGDTWVVAAGSLFDNQRQNIINGIDSAQAEGAGWDAVVKAGLAVTDVVRTSNSVVTVTLPAFATYNITATETITVTVPATATALNVSAIVGSPTFTVSATASGAGPAAMNYFRQMRD